MATRKLILTLSTVEDGGLLVNDRVYPEKQYVFVNPRGFYEWLCSQMGTNAKPDIPTECGRTVINANKLDALYRIYHTAIDHMSKPYDEQGQKDLRRAISCFDSWSAS